jgi:hypothetical protein
VLKKGLGVSQETNPIECITRSFGMKSHRQENILPQSVVNGLKKGCVTNNLNGCEDDSDKAEEFIATMKLIRNVLLGC